MRTNTLSLILALLMTAVQGAFAWDGSGTTADPYEIRNSADWATLATEVAAGHVAEGTYFKLVGDISISTPVGTSDHRFNGTFDGGGHTITATLSVASGSTAPFAYVENATISHLHVDGTIQGGRHTAGITSSVLGTGNKIEDCHVSAKITTFPESDMIVAGGIVGHGNEATLTVEGCLFDGSITATSNISYSYAGAIVGWCGASTNITVKNCIENATYTNISHAGMNYTYGEPPSASVITSANSYSLNHNWSEVKHGYKITYLSDSYPPQCTATATYATTGIQALPQGLKLGDVFYLGSGESITFESYELSGVDPFMGYCFSAPESNVTINSGDQTLTMPAEDVYMSFNDMKGSGDENDPYLIQNAGDWLYFTFSFAANGTQGYHFLLTDDIDIYTRAGYVLEGTGDLCFTGVFDGGGHTITAHLNGGDNMAPFYKLNGGTIKNLHVAGEITGGLHTAGLVAGIWGNGNTNLIENCRVSATINCTSTHAGGFVGHASSSTTTLRGCLFDGTISGGSLKNAGYLVGWCANSGNGITLEDCATHDQHVYGDNTGCTMDLVLDETATGRCGSATNTYGGINVGSVKRELTSGHPALKLTYAMKEGLTAPVEYSVSHLASYGTGLLFDNEKFFVASTATPRFQISISEGLAFSNVTAGDATVNGPTDGWYSLSFANSPNGLIAINATIASTLDFEGEGTEASPYLIRNTAEWVKLSLEVAGGNSYAGKVFRLTKDIDCGGTTVGTDSHPFSGTFDGDGHTLTQKVGNEYNPVATAASPFYRVSEATFRHLHTAGKVCTSAQYTGGIISQVFGTEATQLYDCHSSMTIYSTINGDASNGGLVGAASNCESLNIERCSFTGNLHSRGGATNCGGFIGWSNVPVTIRQSLFDPAELIWYNLVRIGQNFARMSDYSKLTMEDCYTTFNFEAESPALALVGPQGTFVVDELYASEGVSYEFIGEPDMTFNGRAYYKNGCWIRTTLDDGISFNHWQDGVSGGCFISDPWTRNGLHQLKDLSHKPSLGVWTSAIPAAETQRTFFGVTYRYLSRRDYHFFISDEDRIAKGWEFENGDNDANMVVYTNNDPSEITAIVGFNDNASDSQTKDGVTGVLIRNDLFKTATYNHTHLGLIAPHAFRNSTNLVKLFFEDNDDAYGNARTSFDFMIDQGAFEGCTNFKELMLMQHTTKGNDHWEGLTPKTTTTSAQVFRVADDAFKGCSNLRISVRADHYQDYLSSSIWKEHQSRFIPYEATDADFTVKGVKYRWYRDVATEDNDGDKNDETGKADMMTRLRLWNGMYQQFNAASLLDTKEDCNVYYASVVGVDDSGIDSENGTMRIYNDPGSYWNYKTITLNAGAIQGNTHVKNIEFWQTNGNSENSYSNLKFVIPNNAFKGCTELKELRLFYYVQDGKDRWMALGPKDVIPGDNIFGHATADEMLEMTEEQRAAQEMMAPEGFKIKVATELFPDFKDDPNWQPYLAWIEPVDNLPSSKGEFTEGGLTYDYMTSLGGILQTSQVVSQDVSWWTAPRIAIEVALAAYTIGSFASQQGGVQALNDVALEAFRKTDECASDVAAQEAVVQTANTQVSNIAHSAGGDIAKVISNFAVSGGAETSMKGVVSQSIVNQLINMGVCDEGGYLIAKEGTINALTIGERALVKTAVFQLARKQAGNAVAKLSMLKALQETADKAWRTIAAKRLLASQMDIAYAGMKVLRHAVNPACVATSTASLISSSCWGGSGSYNADALNKGMRENILANIHQVGLVGGGYVITTPQKNLVYHTYIKSVGDDVQDAVIYAGFDNDNNTNTSNRTMTFLPSAFQNKTNLETVKFHEISDQSSNTGMPFLFTIPDEAFKGCTKLSEFSTLLQTDGNGTRALGPENFILGGDNIFADQKTAIEIAAMAVEGKDITGMAPFQIIIDPLRKDDFLASESWKPLEKFFVYESALPAEKYSEYGAKYAYAYEQNSIKKEHKETGHLIEHTLVVGPDNDFITGHQGAVKLCNDIGVYNNYQLDEVKAEAFKDNKNVRSVSFVDLYGAGAFGDCYTDLKVHLGDRAFQGCSNLADLDLLYMVTDGSNHIEPMTPQMISIGKDVFKDSPARIKMMPQQVAWFEADDAWKEYKDRFMPCVVRLSDPGVKEALKDMAYYDPANTGTDPAYWEDYCDFARIGGAGFSWMDGKFTAQKNNIYSFADFRWFESVGLDYVGASWFEGCSKLANIVLPSTIKTIGAKAFNGCSSLKEIELPEDVTNIGSNAFDGCTALDNIVVRGDVPATLGANAFHKHSGLTIWVPTEKWNDYMAQWSDYADYIQQMYMYPINKEVTVTEPGQLATKLGLNLIKENSKVRYIQGPYAKYDSLTVKGPLNGEDVAVLRHMMGANAWESEFTDGQLRYLNLWDADLKEDNVNSYNGYGVDEYLEKDNWVGEYMFHNCNALESVILPKTVTEIGENTFQEAFALKRIAVGKNTTKYTRDLLQKLTGIEELVFLTDNHASSESSDPWEAPIQQVYTLPSQLGDYLGDTNLTNRAQNVTSPFSSDILMWTLADKGHFFPSQYLELENVENIFNGNTTIKDLDEFYLFQNVKQLDKTFYDMSNLETITLPSSVEDISYYAFYDCTSLKTIHISSVKVIPADENAAPESPESQTQYILPTLADDAFCTLPSDFQILVPKEYCKLYRERWAPLRGTRCGCLVLCRCLP